MDLHDDDESVGLLHAAQEEGDKFTNWRDQKGHFCGFILIILLLASTLISWAIVLSYHLSPPTILESRFAGLQRNREEPYVIVTGYSGSDNETDHLWKSINIDHGVVALSDEWATQRGLRTAQRFPWDETKGIYILHGFHNLHCLKIVYLSLSEFRNGEPQSRATHHVNHCLDALRRQVLCDADDTPRATDRRKEVVSGVFQHRQCRSWDELEKFAKKHTACYHRPDDPEAGDREPILERFKHCPSGSGYVIKDDYIPHEEVLSGLPDESLDGH